MHPSALPLPSVFIVLPRVYQSRRENKNRKNRKKLSRCRERLSRQTWIPLLYYIALTYCVIVSLQDRYSGRIFETHAKFRKRIFVSYYAFHLLGIILYGAHPILRLAVHSFLNNAAYFYDVYFCNTPVSVFAILYRLGWEPSIDVCFNFHTDPCRVVDKNLVHNDFSPRFFRQVCDVHASSDWTFVKTSIVWKIFNDENSLIRFFLKKIFDFNTRSTSMADI